VGGKAQIDAVVAGQVLRRLRRLVLSEVGGRTNVIVQRGKRRMVSTPVVVDTMWTPSLETMKPLCGGPLLSNSLT
jgi:hypothetical protein